MSAGMLHGLSAQGITLHFDAALGLLDGFTVTDDGKRISPLHRAPWVGTDEAMPPGEAPLMRKLGGDFFCAPFGLSEADSPLHGWPPNSAWDIAQIAAGHLTAVLRRKPQGATLTKELTLRDASPFVYQCHRFTDGAGTITASNHANVSVPTGAIITTSPKSMWETPATPLEGDPALGRSCLSYPAQSRDPRAFPGVAGTVDLTRYPWGPAHEDFVAGLEAGGHALGWTAVVRIGAGDAYLSLRNPRHAPMTMLWHSNGGRDYAPWSGRHFGCLGVEEGAAEHMLGLSNAADLTGPGAVSLAPGRTVDMRHVIGAIAWPTAEPIVGIEPLGDTVVIRGADGATRIVPFDADFLALDRD